MPRRAVVAVALVLFFLLAGSLPAPDRAAESEAPQPGFNVELIIYRNGEIIYYDPDDPAVQNLAFLIAELLDLDNGALEAPTGNRMDGAQTWSPSYNGNPIIRSAKGTGYTYGTQGAIIFGEDSLFSRSDYTMPKIHGIVMIDEFNISIANDTIKIIVGGSYTLPATAPAPINVSCVGLGLTTAGPGNVPSPSDTWLLFKDPLSVPIKLNPGDTIHVRYIISLP